MPIEDRNLKAGTKLVTRYKGDDYRCEVAQTKDGLRYRLPDGKEFKTPSGAGKHIRGGKETNGWDFWSVEGQEPKPKAARKGNPSGKAKGFKRLEDGRFFCNACMEPFDAPKDVTPQGCPQGHSPDGKAPKPKKEATTA